MKSKKIVSIFLLITLMPLIITGCWDKRELEDQAFILTIGIDKGKQDQLLVTFRIAIPSKSGLGQGGGGGGGGGQGSIAEQASLLTTIEAPSVTAATVLASGFVNREISLLHTKAIVIGETFARDGVGRVLSLLSRYRELRRNVFVCVAQGKAYEFIKENRPDLEKSYAKWWEGIKMMELTEGSHPGTLFHDFITDAAREDKEATMIYLATNKKSQNIKPENLKFPPAFENGELKVKAGEIPRVQGNPAEHMGTAVFKGDKMVDVLDLTETNSLLMLTGEFKRTHYIIADPAAKHTFISLEVKQGSLPNIKVSVKGDSVSIVEKVHLEGDLIGVQSPEDYGSNPKAMEKLNTIVSHVIETRIKSLIKKEQALGTDTVGFGRYVKRHFLTTENWINYNWLNRFKDADISVKVNFQLRRTGMQGKQPGPYTQ